MSVLSLAFATSLLLSRKPPAAEIPNLVVVFVDDLGYGDLGCFGAEGWRTPRIDGLAREGMRLTDFYVAQPVCSASRAALLTGCYANRIGIHGALGPGSHHGIAAAETTLAEVCKARGMATAAFGKWHLGHHPQFLPTRHGFDEFHGIPYSNDMWPAHPESPGAWLDLPLLEGERIVGYNTDQNRFTADFTRRSVEFIERSAAADRPFFLYLAHPMPHVPLHASEAYRGSSPQGLYGDVVQEIDASVGAILDALDRSGQQDRTWVIFTSDNGPWLSYGDHAGGTGPLREGKGTTFEGGVRVPCVMRWPGQIPAGTVQEQPIMTIDLLPTVAAVLGVPLPDHPIDGRDVLPLLRGEAGATSPHAALFFYYHENQLEAMRAGRWKLHFPHGYRSMRGRAPGAGGVPGKYDYGVATGLELYDLQADVGENANVAAEHPDVIERLQELAAVMRDDLGDAGEEQPGRGHRPPDRVLDSP